MNYEMEAELPQRQAEFGLRKAAEKALEAMENNLWAVMDQAPAIDVNAYHAAIVALRAALAEPDEVAAERDACLKIIERYQATKDSHPIGDLSGAWMVTAFEEIKATIRARGINE